MGLVECVYEVIYIRVTFKPYVTGQGSETQRWLSSASSTRACRSVKMPQSLPFFCCPPSSHQIVCKFFLPKMYTVSTQEGGTIVDSTYDATVPQYTLNLSGPPAIRDTLCVRDFLEAAKLGDLSTVEKGLKAPTSYVNCINEVWCRFLRHPNTKLLDKSLHYANFKKNGESVSFNGHVEVVKLLKETNANLDLQNEVRNLWKIS